jgi:hypothetical protein
MLNEQQQQLFLSILKEYPVFAETFLKIRTKDGAIRPFLLNKPQRFLHESIENQLKTTGMVRKIILKSRQQGCSTYIGGRFYKNTAYQPGKKCYILTHEQSATDNLFNMVKHYHENIPEELRPTLGNSNAKELVFSELNSGYKVATAGNRGAGRSDTSQFVHACIAAGTELIDGATGGLRDIKDVNVGDAVVTHNGHLAIVTVKSSTVKDCLSITVKTVNGYPFVASYEHEVFTARGWVEARDLVAGDKIGYPIRQSEVSLTELPLKMPDNRLPGRGGKVEKCDDTIALDYDFGRLVGVYLADGSLKVQSNGFTGQCCAITIADDVDELPRIISWFEKYKGRWFTSMSFQKMNGKSRTREVVLYGKSLACCMGGFVGEKTGKQLPFAWWTMPREFLTGILHGYLSGDGYYRLEDNGSRSYSCGSVLSTLTLGMRDLMAFLGYGWATLSRREAGVRYGRNEQEQFLLKLNGAGSTRLNEDIKAGNRNPEKSADNSQKVDLINGHYWLPIVDIQPVGTRDVYDLEVCHEDHSYCLVNGAVSNSETAYWPSGEEHIAGLMQTVPSAPGTEILVESTANGIGNIYHELWEKAVAKRGGWEAVFIPWTWQEEYALSEARASILGVSLQPEDREYAEIHNLPVERSLWRRFKIDEMGQEVLFRREYPTTPNEAFDSSNEMSFMSPSDVNRARKVAVTLQENGHAPTILGVDPARSGMDATCIVLRRGRYSEKLAKVNGVDTMGVVGIILRHIQKYQPHAVFIDQGGIGAGIVDRLRELGYVIVRGVDFGGSPLNDKKYTNKRNEMWGMMKEWILDQPAKIPDDDSLHTDLTGINISKYDSHNRAVLESKDDFKKRFHRSPDTGDALALTFAFPVIDYDQERRMLRASMGEEHEFDDIRISVPGMGY